MRSPTRRRCLAAIAGIASLAAGGLIAAAPAQAAAADPCSPNHCYGNVRIDVNSPSGFSGGTVTLRTNCMTIGDPSTEIATNELWFVKGDYWVETGIFLGDGYYLPVVTKPRGFWADNTPNGFTEHFSSYGPQYTLNSSFTVAIERGSSGINVYGSGTLRGTSVGNFSGGATSLIAGNESSTSTVHTFGSSRSLQWRDLNNPPGWHNGWTTSSTRSYIPTPQAPMYVTWVNQYVNMRSGAGASC